MSDIRSVSLVLSDACVCLLLFTVISWMFSDMTCSFNCVSSHWGGQRELACLSLFVAGLSPEWTVSDLWAPDQPFNQVALLILFSRAVEESWVAALVWIIEEENLSCSGEEERRKRWNMSDFSRMETRKKCSWPLILMNKAANLIFMHLNGCFWGGGTEKLYLEVKSCFTSI